MKRVYPVALLLAAALLLSGCCPLFGQAVTGSGNIITEERAVTGYNRVQVTGVARATVRQDGREGLVIRADDNLVPLIRTEVRNDILYITLTQEARYGFVDPSQTFEFTISADDLVGVVALGEVEMDIDAVDAPSFDIEVAGSSRLMLGRLTTERMEAWVSGTSMLQAAGVAPEQRAEVKGEAVYDCAQVQSRDVAIVTSGSAHSTVWASERLTVTGAGTTEVSYYGEPQVQATLNEQAKANRLEGQPQ